MKPFGPELFLERFLTMNSNLYLLRSIEILFLFESVLMICVFLGICLFHLGYFVGIVLSCNPFYFCKVGSDRPFSSS